MQDAPAFTRPVTVRAMLYSKLSYTVADGVAVITLNDPPANTYSYEMMRELDEVILSARMDPGVHVIVLTGQGDKFFCAGANIRMLGEASPDFKYYFVSTPMKRCAGSSRRRSWSSPRSTGTLSAVGSRWRWRPIFE